MAFKGDVNEIKVIHLSAWYSIEFYLPSILNFTEYQRMHKE